MPDTLDDRIPEGVIERLPVYLNVLIQLRQDGQSTVSSARLGELTSVNPAQIRRETATICLRWSSSLRVDNRLRIPMGNLLLFFEASLPTCPWPCRTRCAPGHAHWFSSRKGVLTCGPR